VSEKCIQWTKLSSWNWDGELLMTAATFVLESCVESILEQKIIFPRFKLEGRILLYGKLFARFGPRWLARLVGQLGVETRWGSGYWIVGWTGLALYFSILYKMLLRMRKAYQLLTWCFPISNGTGRLMLDFCPCKWLWC
jgi:hypothetical protein